MMFLLEQINKNFIDALKSKNVIEVSTLRMLKSALKNKQIQLGLGKKLTEEEVGGVIGKEIKQRKESAVEYKRGNRPELAQKEKREIKILEKYLPEQLSIEEIKNTIEKTILELGATGPQDMGKVMGKVMPQLKGKADGALVSRIVKEKLEK